MTTTAAPDAGVVVRRAAVPARAVVLVLPGGKADSFEPTAARQLTAARMRPIAASLHRAGAPHGVEVRSLRYRVRGWNGAHMSPLTDAQWALDAIRAEHGDLPIALVGHSMGGRVAMRMGGNERVRAVVGLAPWLPDGEPVLQLAGRRLLIAHGDLDKVTSPRASKRFADRAAAAGSRASYVRVCAEMHAMLVRWRSWHRLATGFALDALGVAPLSPRLRVVLDRGYV